MAGGYNEQTYVGRNAEIYGQDGFGWYTFTIDAERLFGDVKGITLRLSTNPTFTYLDGMTEAKLRSLGGFIKST